MSHPSHSSVATRDGVEPAAFQLARPHYSTGQRACCAIRLRSPSALVSRSVREIGIATRSSARRSISGDLGANAVVRGRLGLPASPKADQSITRDEAEVFTVG